MHLFLADSKFHQNNYPFKHTPKVLLKEKMYIIICEDAKDA